MNQFIYDVKRDIVENNTDETLVQMVKDRILFLHTLHPDQMRLELAERENDSIFIWFWVCNAEKFDKGSTDAHESLWINMYMTEELDDAKKEVYRLQKLLSKNFKDFKVRTNLRGWK